MPVKPETGFLEKFLHLTREIYSETRFLSPQCRKQKPGALEGCCLLSTTCSIISLTAYLLPSTAPLFGRLPVERPPARLTLAPRAEGATVTRDSRLSIT
ncbi:hypothetical protein [Kamptonema formosum]|uniref:hypothetical protein n=1 Tax=Kamptonema formosum TaxID=331992 RepID=UPI00034C6C8D|nr:hypothetical protein [Oscillatoria sp. PCC 10802]